MKKHSKQLHRAMMKQLHDHRSLMQNAGGNNTREPENWTLPGSSGRFFAQANPSNLQESIIPAADLADATASNGSLQQAIEPWIGLSARHG